jgi:hypothetical protein
LLRQLTGRCCAKLFQSAAYPENGQFPKTILLPLLALRARKV